MVSPNRFYCTVLCECRSALKKLNIFTVWLFKKQFALLLEELQIYGNRMESALADKSDLQRYHNEAKELEAQLKTLRMEKEELEANIDLIGNIQKKQHRVDRLHNKQIGLIRDVNELLKKKDELCEDENDGPSGYEIGGLFQ